MIKSYFYIAKNASLAVVTYKIRFEEIRKLISTSCISLTQHFWGVVYISKLALFIIFRCRIIKKTPSMYIKLFKAKMHQNPRSPEIIY